MQAYIYIGSEVDTRQVHQTGIWQVPNLRHDDFYTPVFQHSKDGWSWDFYKTKYMYTTVRLSYNLVDSHEWKTVVMPGVIEDVLGGANLSPNSWTMPTRQYYRIMDHQLLLF